MKIKDVISNLGDLGQSPLLNVNVKATANSAYWLIDAIVTELEVKGGFEPQAVLAALKDQLKPVAVDPSLAERYQALLHFVEQVAPVVDLAAECEVAGADQMKALFRTLNLSTPSAVHPDAGMTAFLISGREHGDDDDAAEVVIATDSGEAHRLFFASQFPDLDYDPDEADKDDPAYFIITDKELGTVDHQGRIVLK
ncbi:hypothetical protein [Pseudomonas serbica]|uniref:hypothetical protein n=1 Tax=Pseudomonas serbica TaxID=2965074 RepID=UPI00237AF721|nr:hypothetical protein [Pseudomonas serbica]